MNMFNGYNQPMFESDPARENALKKPGHVASWSYSQNFYHNQENPPVSSSSAWHTKSPYPGVAGKCACAECLSGYHKNPQPMATSQERMLFGGSSGGGGGGGSDYAMEGYQRTDAYHRGGALMPKGYPSCSYPDPTAQNFNARGPVKQHPNTDFPLDRNQEQYMRLFGAPPYGHKLPEQRPKFFDGVNGPFYPTQPYQYPPSPCRYPPYNNPYYYQGSSQPQPFQSQQPPHSGPQSYYGIAPNPMRPIDTRLQLPAHLAKQDNSANKISPLRLMRKKKLAEPAGQLSPPRLPESQPDGNRPLDVRHFLASWADDDEESPPVPQMVVLDCQELNDQQAALLRLYEESTVRSVEDNADPPQSKLDNHNPEAENKQEIIDQMEAPVKNPPASENPVISNQTDNKLISPPPASLADSHDASPIQPELPTSEYRKNKFLDYDGPELPSVVPTRPLTPPIVEPVTETLPPKKTKKRRKKPTIKFSIKKSHDLKISLQVMNDGDNDVVPEETEARSELDPDSRDSMTLQLEDTCDELDLRTKRAKKIKRKRALEEVYSVSSEDQYSDIAADGFQVEESIDSAKIKLTFKRRRGDHDGNRPRDDDLKKAKKSKRLKNLADNDVEHGAPSPGDERAVADTTTDYNGHPPNDELVFYPAAESAKDPLGCDEPLANVTGPSNEADSSHPGDDACSIGASNNSNTSSPKITSSCHITSPRTSTDSIERELQAIWNGDDRDAAKDNPPAVDDQVSSNERVFDFYTEHLATDECGNSVSNLDHDKPLDLRGAFHPSNIEDETNIVNPHAGEPVPEGEEMEVVEREVTEVTDLVENEQSSLSPIPEAEKIVIQPDHCEKLAESNSEQISLVESDLRLSTDSSQRSDELEELTEVTREEETCENEPKEIDKVEEQEAVKPSAENSPLANLETGKILSEFFPSGRLDHEMEHAPSQLISDQEQKLEDSCEFFPEDENHGSQNIPREDNRNPALHDIQAPFHCSDQFVENQKSGTDQDADAEQQVSDTVSGVEENLVKEKSPRVSAVLGQESPVAHKEQELSNTLFANDQQTEITPDELDLRQSSERVQENVPLVTTFDESLAPKSPGTPERFKVITESAMLLNPSWERKGPRTPDGFQLTPMLSPIQERKGPRTPEILQVTTETPTSINPSPDRKGARTPERLQVSSDLPTSPIQEKKGPMTPEGLQVTAESRDSITPVQDRKGPRTPEMFQFSDDPPKPISPVHERKGPSTPKSLQVTAETWNAIYPVQDKKGPRTPEMLEVPSDSPMPISPIQERNGSDTAVTADSWHSISHVQDRKGPRTPEMFQVTADSPIPTSPVQDRKGPRTPKRLRVSSDLPEPITPDRKRKGPMTPERFQVATDSPKPVNPSPKRKGPMTPERFQLASDLPIIPRTPERLQVTADSPKPISPAEERKGPRTPAGEPPTPNHYASSCSLSPQSPASVSPKNCESELFTYRRGPRTPEDEPLSNDSNSPAAFYVSPIEAEPEIGPRTPEEISIEPVTEELVLATNFPQTSESDEKTNSAEIEMIPLAVAYDLLANDSDDRDSDYEVGEEELARIFVCVQCLSPITTPQREIRHELMNEPGELTPENYELVEESVEWVSDENANIVMGNVINFEESEIVNAVEPVEETVVVETVAENTCNKSVTNEDYELEEGEIVDEYVLLEISDDDDEVIVCDPVVLDVSQIPLPLGPALKENCFDLDKIREMRKTKEVQSVPKTPPTEDIDMSRNPSPPGTPRIQSPTQLPDDACVDLKELCCDDDEMQVEEQEIVNVVEPTEEAIVVEPVYELEEDAVPNDAMFQDVMANCLANAEKFLDREDGEIADDAEVVNKSMSSRDVLLSSSFEAPSDLEIGCASSGEVSSDFSPCYTALGTESLPVDNWPYLEEEVPLSPDWPVQEENVPMQEDIPGQQAVVDLPHPLLPKKSPTLSIANLSMKKSRIRRRTVEAVKQSLAPRSKFSSERQCTDSDVELDLVKERFLAWQKGRAYMKPQWQPKVMLSRVATSAETSSESNTLQSDCEQAFRAVKPDRCKENKVKPGNAQLVKCYEHSKETKRASSHSKILHRSAVKSESHSSDEKKLVSKEASSRNKHGKIVDAKANEKHSHHRREKHIVNSDSGLRKTSETDFNSRPKTLAKISKNVEKVIYSKTHLDCPDGKVLEEDVSGNNKTSHVMKVLPSPAKRSHRSPRKSIDKSSSKRHVCESPRKWTDHGKSKVPHASPKKEIADKRWVCEVCSFDNEDERSEHVKTHTFCCWSCDLAFISEANFMKHLEQSHQDLRTLHHCRLCELSFETSSEFNSHLETREHTHLEAVEKNTINTLFALLTGKACPSLGPYVPRPKWLPNDPTAVHFYHQCTPLSLATEYWNQKLENGPNP